MSLTLDQALYLDAILSAFTEDSEACNAWERGFLKDNLDRYEEEGSDAFFSKKQWEIVIRISYEKYGIDKDDHV
jgi:hypothetical protein